MILLHLYAFHVENNNFLFSFFIIRRSVCFRKCFDKFFVFIRVNRQNKSNLQNSESICPESALFHFIQHRFEHLIDFLRIRLSLERLHRLPDEEAEYLLVACCGIAQRPFRNRQARRKESAHKRNHR